MANYRNRFSENIDNYIHYCIRNYTSNVNRNGIKGCIYSGARTFQKLYDEKRSFYWLLENNIPIDTIDVYGQYRDLRQRNDSAAYNMNNYLICLCSEDEHFGQSCNFVLPYREDRLRTIELLLYDHIQARIDSSPKILVPSCYIVLGKTCSFESQRKQCLEWRDICDHEWDCTNGEDERRCWELEMNSCDSKDEFRCQNGLCIPRTFLFDGDFDCMDGSDERRPFPDHLCYETAQFDCEERMCPMNTISCGDGQCIDRIQYMNRQVHCANGHEPSRYVLNKVDMNDKCDQYPDHFFRCLFSNECMSKYRLFDGYDDCSDKSDENITNFNSSIDKLFLVDRYECETVPGMIMLHLLGDGVAQCSDFSDELNTWINWRLIECQQMTDEGCSVLRKASSWKNDRKYLIIPFDALCNTVWDVAYGFDEMHCEESQWICPRNWRKYDRYNVSLWSGQCAPRKAFGDGHWDLPDAQDEFNYIQSPGIFDKFLSSYLRWPCVSVTTGQKMNITQHRHLLGNGEIDCNGGQDERYSIACHDGLQIQDRFRCSDGTCIYLHFACDDIKHCADGDDESSLYCTTLSRTRCSKSELSNSNNKLLCHAPVIQYSSEVPGHAKIQVKFSRFS